MNNKLAVTMYLLVITLNINGLNAPINRYRVTEWIRKQGLCICRLQETNFRSKDTQKTESKGMEKDISHKWK